MALALECDRDLDSASATYAGIRSSPRFPAVPKHRATSPEQTPRIVRVVPHFRTAGDCGGCLPMEHRFDRKQCHTELATFIVQRSKLDSAASVEYRSPKRSRQFAFPGGAWERAVGDGDLWSYHLHSTCSWGHNALARTGRKDLHEERESYCRRGGGLGNRCGAGPGGGSGGAGGTNERVVRQPRQVVS